MREDNQFQNNLEETKKGGDEDEISDHREKTYEDEDWNDEVDNQSKLKEALRAVLRVKSISIYLI
jgi:hypothetical protein